MAGYQVDLDMSIADLIHAILHIILEVAAVDSASRTAEAVGNAMVTHNEAVTGLLTNVSSPVEAVVIAISACSCKIIVDIKY